MPRLRPVLALFALVLTLLAALAMAGCEAQGTARGRSSQTLGLFTSLPILWPETASATDLLRPGAAPAHWAQAVLARHGSVRPLDTLDHLADIDLLVMAQPRPLSPQENVALDDWVQGGGRLLLVADPMLTAESAFSLGDGRRPQDIVLLSPILERWGLVLQFDDAQPAGERTARVWGATIPVNLPGRFAVSTGGGACRIEADGLVAHCRLGRGEVVALADAALLEASEGAQDRAEALGRLLDRLEAGNQG